ncbi:hypothetical protein CB1_004359002 [Camelus ferus]|nr:hypothetical protein CB1_004359002 [Camelus ferus]
MAANVAAERAVLVHRNAALSGAPPVVLWIFLGKNDEGAPALTTRSHTSLDLRVGDALLAYLNLLSEGGRVLTLQRPRTQEFREKAALIREGRLWLMLTLHGQTLEANQQSKLCSKLEHVCVVEKLCTQSDNGNLPPAPHPRTSTTSN